MAGDVRSGGNKWSPTCVLVCNFHPNIPDIQTVLRDYFENKPLSGGGPVCKDGIVKTQSEREALVEFEQRLDANQVVEIKTHIVKYHGEDLHLEVVKCPMSIYLKYKNENQPSSTTDNSTEDFVVVHPTEQSQMTGDEEPDSNMLPLTTDNQPPDSTAIPQPSPRDASIPAGPVSSSSQPGCYQSNEVLRLQREKEARVREIDEKINEALQKEKLRQSMVISEEDKSFTEKGVFESTEKETKLDTSAQRPQEEDMDTSDGTPGSQLTAPGQEYSGTQYPMGSPQNEPVERIPGAGQSYVSQIVHRYEQEEPDPAAAGAIPKNQKRGGSKPAPRESQPPVKKVHNADLDLAGVHTAGIHKDDNAMEEYDAGSRTVVVEGITERLDVEMVELFFENSKKSGGGSLEKIDYQEKSGRAILVFEEKEHAKNVLSKEKFTISGIEVTVHEETEPEAATDTAAQKSGDTMEQEEDEDIVIKVSGIQPNMDDEMLGLFFEHERKSGGGECKDFQVDFKKGEALITYVDSAVAERVLARKTLDFKKARMTVSRFEKHKWDRKTVLLTGIGDMTEEMLELLYENKKKSGGGPVKSINMTIGSSSALVTFMNEADAESVLQQGIVKRKDGSMIRASKPSEVPMETGAAAATASSSRVEATQNLMTNSIMVLGIDENVTEDVLENLFENEEKSGGGPVEKITMDPEFQMATVTFLKLKVAQRVLARSTIKLDNLTLILQPHVPENDPTPEGAVGGTEQMPEKMDMGSDPEEAKTSKYGKFNCIEVSGLPPTTKMEFVRLFFESPRYSGGGEIDKVTMNGENGTAVIIFKDEASTKRVLQRHHDSPLAIESCKVQIKAIDTSLYGGTIPTNTSCAIQVTGIPVNASDDSLQMFFENRRVTGGELLEEIVHNSIDGRAVLTYASTEVAQRVIAKHQAQPIHYEGNLLQIQMLYSNSRPAQIVGPKETNLLFLKNVNDEATADDIRFFLERVPNCKVQESVFGIKQGTVLVCFVSMPGFEKFYELSCKKPLKGSMVNIESVPRSKSIEVYGAEVVSAQNLQMYFEHNRSQGGDVHQVDILTEEKCAIITFDKHGVAERVLSQPNHTVVKRKLIVRIHHECIGILPPHHDHTSPGAGIPSHCTVDKCDPNILAFILSTPPNRKYMEQGIASIYGNIQWPDNITDNVQVQIQCTLPRSIPGLSAKVKTWSVDVTGVFNEMLGNFVREEINVLQEAWREFVQVTGDLMPQNSDDVEVTVDRDNCTVAAVGKRNSVDQLMDNLRQASANVEDKLKRQAQIIPETVNNLKAYQIKFLLAHKFPQNTKQIFQDMKIEADLKQKKLVFNGVPSDIITAKLQMYELINQMRYEKLTLTRQVCQLLKQKKTREYLVTELQKRDAIVVWDVSDKPDGEVMVYAKTAEELTSGVAIIRSSIVENQLNVPEENRPCLRQPGWSQIKDTMIREFEGELRINVADDTSSLSVAANCQIIEAVLEKITTYMNENTVLEKFVNMERGRANLLEREKKQELRKIESDFKDYSVKLNKSDGRPGYVIQGTKDGLSRALVRVDALGQTIVICDHNINKPGMPQYFLSDRGHGVLASLESRFRVVVIVGDEEEPEPEESAAMSRKGGAKKSDRKPVSKATAILDGGRKVKVVQGDITSYCVDAIVNAANEEMLHIGGVAKAIVDRGGMEIQQECSKVVAVEGKLLPGAVYTSQAGKLPCRKIIHTVGPKWQGGWRNEENELYDSVYACLEEASSQLGFKTIALPAISSGVFGFPIDKCCNTILSAVKDYCKKETSSSLKEIHLIDNNNAQVSSLLIAAKQVLGEDKVKSEGVTETGAFPVGHYQAVQEATGQSTADTATGGSTWWTKVTNGVLQSKQGLKVTIVKGSIIDQQVDVIVNTTNKELNLGSGGVSSMILKAAGQTIQQQCSQKAPNGLKPSEVVETNGGNLACGRIYHGACSNYQGQNSIKELRQFLTNCLTKAHASSLTSIAIPAIGTGNLNFPRPEVALAMYEETKAFSEKHVGTSLQQIDFVLYDRDIPTIQAFQAEVDRLLKPGSSSRGSTHRQMVRQSAVSPDRGSKGAYSSSQSGAYGSSQRIPAGAYSYSQSGAYGSSQRIPKGAYGSSAGIETREISQLHLEHLKVIVVKGDITKETTDAIINSTGDDLNFSSQVSRAILRAAGRSVARECEEIGNVGKNHIAVTSAGDLQCNHIIHVGAPYDPDRFRYQSKWKTRINEILKTAVSLKCATLSFPALGTGTLSVDASKMASTIFDVFYEFGKKDTCVDEIRVVVFEDRMIETFEKELQNMTKKGKGVFEALTEKLSNMFSSMSWGSTPGDVGSSVDRGVEQSGPYRQRMPYSQPIRSTPIDESILSFHIYGFNKSSLDQVTDQIDKTCKDETQDKVLDSKDDQEVIRKLSNHQIEKIKGYERSHHVKITIDKKQRIARLRIQGLHADVLHVMDKIYRIFRETEQEDRYKQEAELLSKQVQWQFMEQGKFQTYPPDMNAVIERAYQDKKPYAEFSEKDPSGGLRSTRVKFKTMKETQKGAGGAVTELDVRRYSGDTVDLPQSWSPMKKDDHFSLIGITAGTPEYTAVEQSFQNGYTQGGAPYNKTILKIQRLQNPSMYKKYMVHKVHLNAANPANTQNERQLWHGTTDDTLTEIHANGFNRSFCGKNGTAYGRGVYFATYATLSDGYAKPNTAGHRYMYQCKVLAGEFTRGNSALLVPPPKDPNKPSIKFDSVVDNTTIPKIFVVFQDNQAYPEYLITYQ